jgi:hypothetical protein
MTNKRTEKSNYKSPSTGEYCTCAQYLAEIMCTRMAQKENEGTQSYKFWNTSKWKKTYSYQVILANRLAKKYECSAIVKAINSKELKHVYSLGYPNLEQVICKYQKIVEQQDAQSTNINIQEEPKGRKNSFGKKSSLQRLRGLNGKEEENK